MKPSPIDILRAVAALLFAAVLANCSQSPTAQIPPATTAEAIAPPTPATARLHDSQPPRFLHEFLLPKGTYPSSIVAGSDGAVWFGTYPYYTNHPPTHLGIGRIALNGKQRYFLFENGVYDVALGGDGRIWFTNAYQAPYSVGAVTTQGAFTQYTVPSDGTPESISADPSQHLWYTAFGGTPDIVEIDSSGSTIATYDVKSGNADKLAYGTNGVVWFVAIANPSVVGRIANGKAHSAPIGGPNYIPGPMALGPDGRMWICDGSMLAAVTHLLVVTRYPLPSKGNCAGVTAGPDGNLWATDFLNSAIVRVETNGTMTEYPTPTKQMIPFAIAPGPDGNIWFTEIQQQTDVSKIGVLQP